MARDGAGVHTMPAGTEGVPNTAIDSADYNSVRADISQAITDSINKDGTKAFAAHQPFGGFKATGLGAGTAATDAAQLAQAQSGIVSHATVVGGTVDAITLTFAPVLTAYTSKMRIYWTSAGVNTITAPTVAIDSIGSTKIIKKGTGIALVAGDTGASGYICEAVYNGTDFILLNPAGALVTPVESFMIAVSDETTAITTGTAKVTFRMPYAFTLTAVRSSLSTASSSGLPTVDINEAGSTILSTKLSIDANEKTSVTAATPAVISDSALANDAEMTIDINTAGTGAKGLKVYLIGRRT